MFWKPQTHVLDGCIVSSARVRRPEITITALLSRGLPARTPKNVTNSFMAVFILFKIGDTDFSS